MCFDSRFGVTQRGTFSRTLQIYSFGSTEQVDRVHEYRGVMCVNAEEANDDPLEEEVSGCHPASRGMKDG